mgnify:FL=1
MKNNILIYPLAVSRTSWRLVVSSNNKKPIISDKVYNKKNLNIKTWELYLHFYNKRDKV